MCDICRQALNDRLHAHLYPNSASYDDNPKSHATDCGEPSINRDLHLQGLALPCILDKTKKRESQLEWEKSGTKWKDEEDIKNKLKAYNNNPFHARYPLICASSYILERQTAIGSPSPAVERRLSKKRDNTVQQLCLIEWPSLISILILI